MIDSTSLLSSSLASKNMRRLPGFIGSNSGNQTDSLMVIADVERGQNMSLGSIHSQSSFAQESQNLFSRFLLNSNSEIDALNPNEHLDDFSDSVHFMNDNKHYMNDYTSKGVSMGKMEWLRNGGGRRT